jgi:ribosomal protein L31E
VVNIFQNRANARAEIGKRIQKIQRTIEELRLDPTATPSEKLMGLIARFDDVAKHRAKSAMESLRTELHALMPSVPAELQGTALRLAACLSWELDSPSAGMELFKRAVTTDRDAGRLNEEFHTLSTWRGFTGYSQWDDLLSDDLSADIREHVNLEHLRAVKNQTAYVKRLSGEFSFPEEETRRIHELARRNGRFPVLWEQAVWSMCSIIDDDPQVLLVLHDRNRRIKRFCVDVGDVLGEAQTTLISAKMYAMDRQYQIAIEEALRVIELDRILDRPKLASKAVNNLKHWTDQIGAAYEARITPVLQQSMWRRSPEAARNRFRWFASLRALLRIPTRLAQFRGDRPDSR